MSGAKLLAPGATDAPIPVHRTKGEMAYVYLREQILSGGLRPGERVTLAALSKMLNISQMPVRDALLRLEREGLVRITPHTDIHVVKLEARDTLELFQIRAALEGLAARLACEKASKTCAPELRRQNARFAREYEARHYAALAEANWAFHRAIVRAADNRLLAQEIEDIWDRCFRFRLGYQLIPGHASSTILEHEAIAAAMEAGDAAACAAAVAAHVERGGRDLLKMMEGEEP